MNAWKFGLPEPGRHSATAKLAYVISILHFFNTWSSWFSTVLILTLKMVLETLHFIFVLYTIRWGEGVWWRVDGWNKEWIKEQIDKVDDGWKEGRRSGWMDGSRSEWIDGWVDGRMNGGNCKWRRGGRLREGGCILIIVRTSWGSNYSLVESLPFFT